MDQVLGIVPLPEPPQALGGVDVGKLLEVQVVQQARHVPEMGIAAEGAGVSLHRRRDHEGVMALVAVLDVQLEERACFGFAWKTHGANWDPQARGKARAFQLARSLARAAPRDGRGWTFGAAAISIA